MWIAPGEVDELGIEIGPLTYREKRAHVPLGTVSPLQHLELKVVLSGDGGCGVGQSGRGDAVGGRCHQLPGQLNAGAVSIDPFQGVAEIGGQIAEQVKVFGLEAWFGLAAEAGVAIQGQPDRFGDRLSGAGSIASPGEMDAGATVKANAGIGQRCTGLTQRCDIRCRCIGRWRIAQTHQHQPAQILVEQLKADHLPRFGLEALLLQPAAQRAVQARLQLADQALGVVGGDPHGQHGTAPVLERGG